MRLVERGPPRIGNEHSGRDFQSPISRETLSADGVKPFGVRQWWTGGYTGRLTNWKSLPHVAGRCLSHGIPIPAKNLGDSNRTFRSTTSSNGTISDDNHAIREADYHDSGDVALIIRSNWLHDLFAGSDAYNWLIGAVGTAAIGAVLRVNL